MGKFLKLWLPVFLWAGIIFFFSGMPDLKTGFKDDLLIRKAAHVIEYFIFTWLLYRAFSGSFQLGPIWLFCYPVFISLLYAVSDEIHQFFVIGRSCSARDVSIDAIGIFGFYLFIKFKKGCICSTK